MALKRRENGRCYLYRSRREGGRVVTDYYGAGPLAQAMAEADAAEQAERQARRAQRQQTRQQLDEIKASEARFDKAVDVLLRARFLSRGFHRKNRGLWRKKRQRSTDR